MCAVLLHVSDLHVGAGPKLGEETLRGLRELIVRHEPEVIVASGDLTHRNLISQHQEAAAFLRSLDLPVVAVPGNHDIPALPPRRFTRTHRAFRDVWEEIEPRYSSTGLTVAGLSSVRPWLYQEGIVSNRQLAELEGDLEQRPGTARVVVTHHHLASAPWRSAKRPLARRSWLLRELARLSVDLVLAGHVHQASAASAPEFYAQAGRGIVVSTMAGLGMPSPGRPAEVRGCQIWEIDADELRSVTYSWLGEELTELARRSFPR